jgi:hypothetical protein
MTSERVSCARFISGDGIGSQKAAALRQSIFREHFRRTSGSVRHSACHFETSGSCCADEIHDQLVGAVAGFADGI